MRRITFWFQYLSIQYQANSAKSESTNTTIKYLIKLARGFRRLENMFTLIYLKCSDIIIPLCNRPQPTKEYIREQRERALERKRDREAAKNTANIDLGPRQYPATA
ncbi:MAG: transposase [Oscillospiraceae bacterium]|nr:transposase [Oscillospiraceae bacterium]